MSDLHKADHKPGAVPTHADVSFEQRDVTATKIYMYLAALALAVIGSYIVCVYVLRITTDIAKQSDTPPPPIREEMGGEYRTMPPEPRLQGVPGHGQDAQYDLRTKMQEDAEANEKIGWIDRDAGIAQIPVEDAKKIIAEKGLTAFSGNPAEKKK
jgi:hypothetical protein